MAEPQTPLLSIRGLEVRYETDEAITHAVNGINLDINVGETVGLVGETGAGKTTTALAVMRLLPHRTGKITEGCILFRGEDVLRKSNGEMRQMRGERISMIFQDPMTSLNPTMTMGEQIRESLEIHNKGMSAALTDARVDELLTMVGIPPRRKHEYPHQFSGGMKQRIVIAIALACRPELLIADEPTTALDVTIQAQVLALMNELKESMRTSMILITHDLGVVSEMCDKVAIMYAGEIIERGSADDILDDGPHHPYTVGLFNSIPDIERESKRLSPIAGLMPDPAALPGGCKFHPRCGDAADACRSLAPPPFVSGEHIIACHKFGSSNGGRI
ncbi:MAG: ABC transporter ATP-binding protein [Synergistaceae bacterium]|jgi:peptide/nickel transport system ATP-binding protein|nr:ABC transporter ATP-binding protein [Synergistaceae bacterium]